MKEVSVISRDNQGNMIKLTELPDYNHEWFAKHPDTLLSHRYHVCEKCNTVIYWDMYENDWLEINHRPIPDCNELMMDQALR